MMYYFFPLSLSLFSPLRSVCSVVSLVRLWRLFGRTFLYLAQYHYQRAIIHVFDYTSLFHFSVDCFVHNSLVLDLTPPLSRRNLFPYTLVIAYAHASCIHY
jgi:hypothetical protein